RLVGDGVIDRRDLADVNLNLGFLRLELPGQAARNIGIEADRERACQRLGGGYGGRDLRRAVIAGRAAEPVIEWDRGSGGAAHRPRHETGNAGDHRVAGQPRRGPCLLAGVVVLHVPHNGRFRTAGPLTMVTAKNSSTSTPSASAIAIERWRRLLSCASVRTIPS